MSNRTMQEQAIRFGVSDGNGNRSSTWKVWTPPGKSDVYLACRELGGHLKASLHESGSWHIGYSEKTYAELVNDVVPTQRGRFVRLWDRPKAIAPGVTLAYRIVTPPSALVSGVGESDDKVKWIPSCPQPKAVEVDIFICSSTVRVTGWPGKNNMGTELIGSYKLANGESIWVVHWVVNMPDLSQATKGRGAFYKGRGEEDLNSGSLRAIVFSSEPDGSRVIYDCAVMRKEQLI